ncbi:MAG: hypothetical protein IJK26_10115 [Clostridia bacterium]|nr:hypothetical protein [Clostridia bacterium]
MSKRPTRFLVRKEICDDGGRFTGYKYFQNTADNVPYWTDDKSQAYRFSNRNDAEKAINNFRFFVLDRMSIEEIELYPIKR